jgi:hypothetical protein
MDLNYKYEKAPKGTSRLSKVTEEAQQKRKQDAQLRLATIANGKSPAHRNGTPYAK